MSLQTKTKKEERVIIELDKNQAEWLKATCRLANNDTHEKIGCDSPIASLIIAQLERQHIYLSTEQYLTDEDRANQRKKRPCFECGKNVSQFKRWFHSDQDDLVCLDCAKVLKHTDTCYAGTSVDDMPVEEAQN